VCVRYDGSVYIDDCLLMITVSSRLGSASASV
jgi:hypothetical protein